MANIIHSGKCPNCGHESDKYGCVIVLWKIVIVVLCGVEDKAVFFKNTDI